MFHSVLRARAHGDHVIAGSIVIAILQLDMNSSDFRGHLHPSLEHLCIPARNSVGEEVRETVENSSALGV